jgi:lambda family phage portal protein
MSVLSRIANGLQAFRSAYVAGRNPPGKPMWRPMSGGPRRTTAQAQQLITDRARDAVRNNPYAARIVDLWVANAVGTGVTTRWKDGARANAWKRWAASLEVDAEGAQDWAGVQALAFRAMVESGEALIRLQRVRPTRANPVGLKLLVLEADLLDATRTGMNGPNRITQGVEVSPSGAPVAYWLKADYDDWPGTLVANKVERVPADEIIHLYRRRRPGQVRDVSWLAPILWMLKDLGDYEAALIRKAEIEACLSVIISGDDEETLTGHTTPPGEVAGAITDRNQAPVEDLQPGMIMYRRGTGQVDVVQPTGGGSHLGFARRTLEAAAVGAGLTYDQVSGDLSQANYSSLRAGKIEFRRLLEQVQYTVLIPRLIERVARRFEEQGVLFGLWGDEPGDVSHVPPAPEMVDPMKDTMALIAQIRAGFVPPQDGPGQFGYDFAQVMQMIAEGNAVADAAGVVLDTDPRRVAKSGGAHDSAQLAAVELAATGDPMPPAGPQE